MWLNVEDVFELDALLTKFVVTFRMCNDHECFDSERVMIMNALFIWCHTIPVTKNIVLVAVPTMIPSC